MEFSASLFVDRDKPAPAGEDYKSPAAIKRLHAEIIQLPTIEESTADILGVIQGFDFVVHFHGTDHHFLRKIGNTQTVLDLGKLVHRFFLPVRKSMRASKQGCTLNQAVTCIVLQGTWRSPHLSLNDALMLQDSFKGLAKLL